VLVGRARLLEHIQDSYWIHGRKRSARDENLAQDSFKQVDENAYTSSYACILEKTQINAH
jgi:hypothetical protein